GKACPGGKYWLGLSMVRSSSQDECAVAQITNNWATVGDCSKPSGSYSKGCRSSNSRQLGYGLGFFKRVVYRNSTGAEAISRTWFIVVIIRFRPLPNSLAAGCTASR